MSSKNTTRLNSTAGIQRGDADGSGSANSQKPIASTLLQEFQNLREKFKNEDDGQEKGLFYLLFTSYQWRFY
jgi:hypothetical protein